jgi:hypothetical protein
VTSASENRDALRRLQTALEAVSEDLDAIEQRPHLYLRHAAEALETDEPPRASFAFVDQIALAMQRSNSRQSAS